MAEYVREWDNDWYSGTYYSNSPGSNPPGPATGDFRVVRGGGWGSLDGVGNLRAAYRFVYGRWGMSSDVGFRCVAAPGM
jgi:formylglycine-generating enzyme required for sulfatase activity